MIERSSSIRPTVMTASQARTPPDPWRYWDGPELSRALSCPLDAVLTHWPILVGQFGLAGLTDEPTMIALASTVAIESAHRFEPIHEFRMADGSIPSYWYTYDGGPEYHGRGYIQNTHLYNYAALGPKIASLWNADPVAFDFATSPDDLLDPYNSAAAAAIYFRDRRGADGDSLPKAAARGDWRSVRQLVQGGTAALGLLTQYATTLGGATEAVVDTASAYSIDVPDRVILQQNNWSCAVRSTYAGLWAMAQVGQGDPVTYGDEGSRDVYEWMVPSLANSAVGLKDGSGASLAAMLRSHGYAAGNVYPCTIDQVRARAGTQAVMLGGQGWYHWSYCRGKTSDGGLVLENPSPGHMGISDYIRDSYDRLGPWAMVWAAPLGGGSTPPVDTGDSMEELQNLVGNAYHEAGVVIPALAGAIKTGNWTEVESVVKWLRENNPHPGQ